MKSAIFVSYDDHLLWGRRSLTTVATRRQRNRGLAPTATACGSCDIVCCQLSKQPPAFTAALGESRAVDVTQPLRWMSKGRYEMNRFFITQQRIIGRGASILVTAMGACVVTACLLGEPKPEHAAVQPPIVYRCELPDGFKDIAIAGRRDFAGRYYEVAVDGLHAYYSKRHRDGWLQCLADFQQDSAILESDETPADPNSGVKLLTPYFRISRDAWTAGYAQARADLHQAANAASVRCARLRPSAAMTSKRGQFYSVEQDDTLTSGATAVCKRLDRSGSLM